jgi:hypothetical protein
MTSTIVCIAAGYTTKLEGWVDGQDYLVYLPMGENLTIHAERGIMPCELTASMLHFCPPQVKGTWKGTISDGLPPITLDIREVHTWMSILFSPGELRVYDSQGHVTGLVNGEMRVGIPDSIYDQENKAVKVFSPSGPLDLKIVGTNEGDYGLLVTSFENGNYTTFAADDIPILPNAIHDYTVAPGATSQGEMAVNVGMDFNGDGIAEQILSQVTALQGGKTDPGDYTVDLKAQTDTVVEKSGSGTPNITIAKLLDNPGAPFTGDIRKYIDVYMPDTAGVDQIEVRLYYTNAEVAGFDESSLRLYWWNGSTWTQCSDSRVNTSENYIWAKIRPDTTPALSDLTGTPFGGGGGPPAFSVASYDTNHNGIISKDEALKAVQDYFNLIITKAQVLEVVAAYFR